MKFNTRIRINQIKEKCIWLICLIYYTIVESWMVASINLWGYTYGRCDNYGCMKSGKLKAIKDDNGKIGAFICFDKCDEEFIDYLE